VSGLAPSSHPSPADLGAALLHLIFPGACAACGGPLLAGRKSALCRECWEGLERLPEKGCARCGWPFPGPAAADGAAAPLCQRCRETEDQFSLARAALWYREDGVARTAILLCKHGPHPTLLRQLGRLLADEGARRLPLENIQAVVPVPLHWRRQWRRGFNQARVLAEAVGRAHGLSVLTRALARARATPEQSGDGEARRRNVRGAFVVRQGRGLAGTRLLLVDDVFTTGATVNACAAALRGAGAADVAVLTLARVA
jgi:ComF family protein